MNQINIVDAVDHVQAATHAVRACINLITDVRIDGGGLTGRSLDHVLEQLVEIERELSRAEGALAA